MMKRILISLTFVVMCVSYCLAQQSATQVLDKCAAIVSAKEGVRASFRMESAQYGNTAGTIALKGHMFHATTPVASIWFDGQTQWTYLEKNNEVNVVTPTENQLQSLNPYNFITLYKNGYTSAMTTSANDYSVHLTATDAKRKIQEVFITIDKKSYSPSEIKLRQGTKWTTFYVSDLKAEKLGDSEFRFNSKDYPTAEVIDLR